MRPERKNEEAGAMTSERIVSEGPDAAAAAARESRDLKNTIAALREAVESARIEREEAVRQALRTADNEIAQLRSTATALRHALEQESAESDRKVQEAVRVAHEEIRQLRAALAALRASVEKGP
jgi:chromosome segregation ATPase